MDNYSTFEKLAQEEKHGIDYRIQWRIGSSGMAILSIHGGEIEPGTTRIANAIAGWDHSFYSFEGIKTAGNQSLHITSTRFNEPTAMKIVCQSDIIISIHGSSEKAELVQLGGLDSELKSQVSGELRSAQFQSIEFGPLPLGGTDYKNICNLCGRGMGVQLEISRGLRAMMFQDLTPQGRQYQTDVFFRFTEAVRKAIAPYSVMAFENRPLLNTD
jgi:phage replication-related protein YjqB (UPF0714/DUF867 family)